jgi:trehalose-6-phosphate synthase
VSWPASEEGRIDMRLVIVSNRLPITITEEGEYRFQESAGGLVSGFEIISGLFEISTGSKPYVQIFMGRLAGNNSQRKSQGIDKVENLF